MICKHCNCEIDEGGAFCSSCGAPVDNPQSVPEQTPLYTNGTTDSTSATIVNQPVPAKKRSPVKRTFSFRKPSKKALILGSVAVVLIVSLLIGICSNWFGFYGPTTKIALAAKNTLQAGSFTANIKVKVNSETAQGSLKAVYNFDKHDITVHYTEENREYLLTDEILYIYYEGTNQTHCYVQSYSDELEELWDAIDDSGDMEDLIEFLEDTFDICIEDYVNTKKIKRCSTTLLQNLNNTSWLKDYLGYSASTNDGVKLYSFAPSSNYKLATEVLGIFEDCFIDEDDYEEVKDGLRDSKSFINDMKISASIGVKHSKLASISCKYKDDSDTITYSIEFSDIGSTKLKDSTIEELIKKYRKSDDYQVDSSVSNDPAETLPPVEPTVSPIGPATEPATEPAVIPGK